MCEGNFPGDEEGTESNFDQRYQTDEKKKQHRFHRFNTRTNDWRVNDGEILFMITSLLSISLMICKYSRRGHVRIETFRLH